MRILRGVFLAVATSSTRAEQRPKKQHMIASMSMDEISRELVGSNVGLFVEPVQVSPEEELVIQDRRDRDSALPRELGILGGEVTYLNKIWNWMKGAVGDNTESILPYPLHSSTYLNQYAYTRSFDPSDSRDANIAGDIVVPPSWTGEGGVPWDLWPSSESISYSFETPDDCAKYVVREAMSRYQEATNNCVRFKEVASGTDGALEISTVGEECYASLGFARDRNVLNLGAGCINVGTAMHLIGHALGLAHEDQRADARNFTLVKPENIDVYGMSASSSVNPVNSTKFPFVFAPLKASRTKWAQVIASYPYEFGSLMHNSRALYAAKIESDFTIVGKDGPKFEDLLGQRGFLTERDASIVNEIYECQRLPIKVVDRMFQRPLTPGLTYDALASCLRSDKARMTELNSPTSTSV